MLNRHRYTSNSMPASNLARSEQRCHRALRTDAVSVNNNQYSEWVGKSETKTDLITSRGASSLAATLDREDISFNEGDSLPPLWQWNYFLEMARRADLSADGHPRKGGFLPPIELPRRMWAGSRLIFQKSLKIGDTAKKTSTIKSIQFKKGRSGTLAFVCVRHKLSTETGIAITEEQDIVYRDMPSVNAAKSQTTPAPALAPEHHDFALSVSPDPVLLFRYSALTLNSHRIHYDRDYATQIEGYPGLIVHGPLLATYLVELVARQFPNKSLKSFEFKAVSPVFDRGVFSVCGLEPDENGRCKLWIENEAKALCVQGLAVLS